MLVCSVSFSTYPAGSDQTGAVSDLGPKHASKGTVSGSLPPSHAADNPQARADGDYTATFANLAQASSRYPCKAWLATQPSSWDSRDHSNVKLVEVNEWVLLVFP